MTGTHRSAQDSGWQHPAPGLRPAGVDLGDDAEKFHRLVALRLQGYAFEQAEQTWQRRFSRDALAPHGLAFFYLDPLKSGEPARERSLTDETVNGYRLRTGTRLFRENDDIGDATALVRQLRDLAWTHAAGGGFDPREDMCTHVDEMTPAARYVGVALSTMDVEPDARWRVVRQRQEFAVHARTRVLVVLVDGTVMQIERAQYGYSAPGWQVRCSGVGPSHLSAISGWRYVPDLAEMNDPVTQYAGRALKELHAVCGGGWYGS